MRLAPLSLAFLLVLALPATVTPAAGDDTWAHEDPEGDLEWSALSPLAPAVPTQGAPHHDHVDLRGLRMEQDAGSVTIWVAMGEMQQGEVSGPSASLEVEVRFAIEGVQPTYEAWVVVYGTRAQDDRFVAREVALAQLGVKLSPTDVIWQDAWADVTTDPPGVRLVFLQEALSGRLPQRNVVPEDPPSPPLQIGKGTRLLDVQARTSGGGSLVGFSDRMPNEGSLPPFVLENPLPNQGAEIAVRHGPDGAALWPGRNQSLVMSVHNNGSTRQLLQMDYRLFAGAPEGLRVFGPPTLSVPAGERREYHLWLETPEVLPPTRPFLSVTGAGVLGEVGYGLVPLVPGIALSPDQNVLFLGRGVYRDRDEVCDHWGSLGCEVQRLLPQPPSGPDAGPINPGWGMGGSRLFAELSFALLRPLATPLEFVPKGPVEVRLRLAADAEVGDLAARLQLDADDATGAVLSGEVSETITPAGTDLVLRAVPAPEGVERHRRLSLRVFLEADATSPAARTVRVLPEGSRITMPLREIPAPMPPGAHSPFQLLHQGERDAFLNPGKAHAYNVTLTNYDVKDQRAQLFLDGLPPAWDARVEPGATFELRPGETVRLGVVVRAPPQAQDGERATLRLNVTSDAGGVTTLPLVALVVTQVDLPDQGDAYRADPDALERLVTEPPAASPGPGLVAALVGLLALLRRRR